MNESKSIKSCLNSLLNLHYPKEKYEIVLIDDGSTDNSLEVVRKTIAEIQLPKIKVIVKKHDGVAAARNVGIQNSDGQILAMIDADAIPDHKWLEELSKTFEKHDADIVCCRLQEVYDVNEVGRRGNSLIHEITFWETATAFKRSVFTKAGLFNRLFE